MKKNLNTLTEEFNRIKYLSHYQVGRLLKENIEESDKSNIIRVDIKPTGDNVAEMLIDGSPITASGKEGFIPFDVIGVYADGNIIKIYAIVLGVNDNRQMGQFDNQGGILKFKQVNKEQEKTFDKFNENASPEHKAIFYSFIKGMEENNEFAAAVLKAVQGTEHVRGSEWEVYFSQETEEETEIPDEETKIPDEETKIPDEETEEEETEEEEEISDEEEEEIEIADKEVEKAQEEARKAKEELQQAKDEAEKNRKEEELRKAEEKKKKAEEEAARLKARSATKGEEDREHFYADDYGWFKKDKK